MILLHFGILMTKEILRCSDLSSTYSAILVFNTLIQFRMSASQTDQSKFHKVMNCWPDIVS